LSLKEGFLGFAVAKIRSNNYEFSANVMAYNLADWDKVWVSVKSQRIGMLGRIAVITR
jgi:hypothetical protein